jgi:hypothetical protein
MQGLHGLVQIRYSRYDVMAFFRKCYAARSMLEYCRESILQLVCIGDMATEAYAACLLPSAPSVR